MSERQQFEGEVVRIEPNGFGGVKFDHAVGANTHGIFSTELSNLDLPFEMIKPGLHVEGVAEIDDKDLAAIRTLTPAHQ